MSGTRCQVERYVVGNVLFVRIARVCMWGVLFARVRCRCVNRTILSCASCCHRHAPYRCRGGCCRCGRGSGCRRGPRRASAWRDGTHILDCELQWRADAHAPICTPMVMQEQTEEASAKFPGYAHRRSRRACTWNTKCCTIRPGAARVGPMLQPAITRILLGTPEVQSQLRNLYRLPKIKN